MWLEIHDGYYRHVSFTQMCIFHMMPHFSQISAECTYCIFFRYKLAFLMATVIIFFVFLFASVYEDCV